MSPTRTLAALAALATALLSADVAAAHWKPSVGHAIERVNVTGTAQGETRPVDVHLWYPADRKRARRHRPTVYTSVLHGVPLAPELWDPLSWTVKAELAREDAPIERRGKRLPLIVFSHGSANDPIDYAHTLELIAGAGFVVAAPAHVNNTQDDVRIDFVNRQVEPDLFTCRDGRAAPCARPNLPLSMADRVRDVSAVLDALPAWLGRRVDTSRAGVLGHSRGTVTALAAAGGSSPRSTPEANCQGQPDTAPLCWPLSAEPRVAAVMGMAIGGLPVIRGVDLANVTVPALLVAGGLDRTSPPANSQFAVEQISSRHKALLLLENATHRSYDSTYCDQVQAAGAIAARNPRALLDRHTFDGIATPIPAGAAAEFCAIEAFTEPHDITDLVEPLAGFEIDEESVPSTGLTTDEVKWRMAGLAAWFFGRALKR
jgi:predicted dienelactone hydrolase